jgi:hypothetical protein
MNGGFSHPPILAIAGFKYASSTRKINRHTYPKLLVKTRNI